MLTGSPALAGTFLGKGRWRSCHNIGGKEWKAHGTEPLERDRRFCAAAAGETWQRKLLGAVS